MLKISNQN